MNREAPNLPSRWKGLQKGDRVIYTPDGSPAVVTDYGGIEPDGDMMIIRFDTGGGGRVFVSNLQPASDFDTPKERPR